VSKKSCPLGEDCDLTIAWMKGAEDARDKAKARIAALEAKLAKAVKALESICFESVGDEGIYTARATLEELKGDKP
jgi:hypothetical protein